MLSHPKTVRKGLSTIQLIWTSSVFYEPTTILWVLKILDQLQTTKSGR